MRGLPRATALAAMSLVLISGTSGCKENATEKTKPGADAPRKTDSKGPEAARPSGSAPADGATAVAGRTDAAPPARPSPAAQPSPPVDPKKPPASLTKAHIATADRIVDASNEFARLLEAAEADCQMATAVIKSKGDGVRRAMGDAEGLQARLTKDPEARRWFQAVYGPKMRQALAKLGVVISICRNHPAFADAFRSLGIGGGPPPH